MFSNFKYGTPQSEIGEIVSVLAGTLPTSSNNDVYTQVESYPYSNTQGKFIIPGRIYNKADYPELYAKIGSIGSSQFTPRTSGTTSSLFTVVYGNGLFLAGGNSGALRSSTDGITWSAVTSPTAVSSVVRLLLYGHGTYVLIEDNFAAGTLKTSTNLVSWTTRLNGVTRMLTGNYSEGIFMVGGDSRVYTSTNATTWTAYNFLAGDPNLSAGSVLYSNGKYLAFGTGRSKTSTDAINWTDITSGPTSDLGLGIGGLAYGNGLYLCSTSSATQFFTSTDAYNWVSISPKTARFARIIYNNGLFVGTASDGGVNLGTSTDGINWTTRYTGTTSYTNAIVYANGLYVYVADGGAVGTSTDAITAVFSTSYDISTQFFVPGYTTGSRFYTTPSYGGNTSARFINYVRAK